MSRQETILQVFVASPSDVAEERAALEDVVRELNATWSRTLRCRLELVRWETHAVPGIGEGPQDVVNRTVPQDYDIFIGMLWAHFGTPTDRAESGTEEEFGAAFAKYTNAPNSVDIMFYFKDEPIAPSRLDPEQLRKIHAFRTRLAGLGLLGSFNTVEDFQNLVRVHLSRLAQKWATAGSESPRPQAAQPPVPALPLPEGVELKDEEEGRCASTTLRHHFVEFSVQRLACRAPFRAVGAC
jgi:hypothetical protein